MQVLDRRRLFLTTAAGVLLVGAFGSLPAHAAPAKKYICPTCGCSEDGKEFDAPGRCPAAGCGMELIEKPEAPAASTAASPQKPAEAKAPKTPTAPPH